MRYILNNKPFIVISFLIICFLSVIGAYTYAESIRPSIDMSTEPYKEIYYWDTDEDGKTTLTGLGGVYNKKIVFDVDEKEDGYTILKTKAEDLPFKQSSDDGGDDAKCSKNNVPITVFSSNGEATSDARVVRLRLDDTKKVLYVDLDNGHNDRDRADELKWYVDKDGNNSAEYGYVGNTYTKIGHECVINLFAYINTSIPSYDPKSLDNSYIYGRVLGSPGMKLSDWVRVTDNKRDYLALDSSAQKEIPDYCKKIGKSNECTVDIYQSYQKCYNWANGIKGVDFSNEFTKDKRLSKTFDSIQRKTLDNKKDYWNHSFRENTAAFIDCFGQRAPSGVFQSENFFKNPGESRALGERIISTTAWPDSINPNLEERGDDNTLPNNTTCSVGMLGWIICPTMDIVSKMTDSLFSFIDDWLDIPPFMADEGSGAYQAWKIFRDIANAIFVISLMVILIGQLIGGGLFANYNLKKIAPKIILIAIAINTSFYLISIMIDISNIVGSSLYGVFKSMTAPIGENGITSWKSGASKFVFAGGALALSVPILTSLSMFIPLCIAAGFSILILLLVLIFRQAIVIVMVMISPLAIACMLMPNTKSWFSKWKKILFNLIWLYPVIAIIFGASKFASAAIIRQGQTNNSLTGELLSLFGLTIQFIPLFITPFALKFGGSTISKIGGMIKNRTASIQNKAKGGAAKMGGFVDRFNKAQVQQRANRIANGNGTALDNVIGRFNPYAASIKRKSKRDFIQQTRQAESDRLKDMAVGESKGLSRIAETTGGFGSEEARQRAESALRAKYEALNKRDIYTKAIMKEADEIKNDKTVDHNKLADEVSDTNLSVEQRKANIQLVVNSNDSEAINRLIKNLSNLENNSETESLRAYAANGIKNNSSIGESNAHLKGPEAAELIKKGASVDQLVKSAYDRGQYTPEAMAKQSVSSAKAITNAKSSGAISSTEGRNIYNNFHKAKANNANSQYIRAGVETEVRKLR